MPKSSNRRAVGYVLAGIVVVLLIVLATGMIPRPDMNLPYLARRSGLIGELHRSDVPLLVRDRYWIGKPISLLRNRLRGDLYDGSHMPADSYRVTSTQRHTAKGETVYWFDASADDWGRYVVVRNQRIESFGYAKG